MTAVRSLLRFLHLGGYVPVGLAGAVPSVAGWRLASLPRGLEAGQVEQLLAACDRGSLVGRRDFAVLMVLARLGLRGAEVAGLRLVDVDWRAGELTVHGKANRIDGLPLPVAVGEALVVYLTKGRPRCDVATLFVTVRAPFRPLSPAAVRQIVARACRRAGLPQLGAHRLRHTLASDMLRAGGSLAEVGQCCGTAANWPPRCMPKLMSRLCVHSRAGGPERCSDRVTGRGRGLPGDATRTGVQAHLPRAAAAWLHRLLRRPRCGAHHHRSGRGVGHPAPAWRQ